MGLFESLWHCGSQENIMKEKNPWQLLVCDPNERDLAGVGSGTVKIKPTPSYKPHARLILYCNVPPGLRKKNL